MRPFTEKYRPSSTKEIQGQNKAIEQVMDWVHTYKTQPKKGILLYGPPGTGKTSMACAIAAELGYELVEVNASDVRNKDAIASQLGASMQQQSLFSTGKIILFDEIDGLSGQKDRGGIGALIDLLKKSAYPVIMTANDPWDKKFATLRKYIELVQMRTLAYPSIAKVMKRICDAEGITYDENVLKTIARRAGGDLRGALTDLQTLSGDKKIDEKDLVDMGERRKSENMFTAMQRIFKGMDPTLAKQAVDVVDEDIDEVFMWIDENIPREYKQGEDIVAAMDAISQADVYRGRIRKRMHWRFLVYVISHLTAGVALSKKEKYQGFTKFQKPDRIFKYWRANQANKKRDAIAQKIADEIHTSVKRAREDALPYVAKMTHDEELMHALDLGKDEVEWLKKSIT